MQCSSYGVTVVTVGVSRWDIIRNEEIRISAGLEETLAEKVDRIVLLRFRHVEMINEWIWQRKVKTATMEGQQRKRRTRFGWLFGLKRDLAFRYVALQQNFSSTTSK